MEIEGLKRAAERLKTYEITAFISDMHPSVHKWARDTWKVSHYFDTWHCVKAVIKKLEKLSKKKGLEDIQAWIQSIRVHLYWCAMSSKPGDHEDIKRKWETCLEHISNNHENCMHGDYEKKKKMDITRYICRK
ncbi:uncharacterized protein LOC141912032 [Tubulanus polymorphus]|uniref:uncharacterized protein LOC141912032 n=1 Tax=Tubulanus polymorphus TaxID=672921 RepID=UPI003DA4A141